MPLNESIANQTGLPIDDISFFQKLFSDTQTMVSDKLISWEMIPEDIYFRLLVIIIAVALILLIIIKLSNFFGGGVKIVLIAVLVLLALIGLGII